MGIVPMLLFSFNPVLICSQTNTASQEDHYRWFDQTIGVENSGLFNGTIYKEEHAMSDDGQKFFFSNTFLSGAIDYDEQSYYDVPMKYDLFEDRVIIKLNNELLLDKDKIDRFSIADHNFEKMNFVTEDGNQKNGFFERLMANQHFDLIKKHKKDDRKKMGERTVYYEFVDKNEYYLLYENKYFTVERRSDIIKIFPDYSGEIKKRFPKSRSRSNREDYLVELLNEVERLISKEDNKTGK